MGSACTSRVKRFDDYCRHKEELAASLAIPGLTSVADDTQGRSLVRIGNPWTQRLFDGPFYRSGPVSLIFVQSRDRNTVADNPSLLGGGETDKHFIYEGLSRVDADGVLAGSATARGENMVFSVWHPELARLRMALGHPRHPAQIVVTGRADLPLDRGLMFQEPSLRVFVVTKSSSVAPLRSRLGDRPWVEVIDAGEPLSIRNALPPLRARGIEVISAVGGRRTATAMLLEGVVDDLYLTTSPIDAGEPNTPFYEGPPLALVRVVEKSGRGSEAGVRFEHFLVTR